jgi:hypothetical protein
MTRYTLGWPRAAVALLILSGRLSGQSTLATFNLTEYFGVNWPVQNIEMKYNAGPPNPATTRLMRQDGTEMPYQWISGSNCWDSTALVGCILVQDGLPAATLSAGVPVTTYSQTYTLQSGIAPAATVTNPVTVTSGTCQSGVAGWIVANGLTGFCVPQTQSSPYNYAPIQGIQLNSGVWTGAVSGAPNLIYQNPVTGIWPNSIAQNIVPYGSGQAALKIPATIFTGETTTFVDSGPLKTSVQLSYTANRPVYTYLTGWATNGGTSTSLSLPYVANDVDCGTVGLYFTHATNLPSPLAVDTVYYNVGCTLSGNTPGNTNYTTTTYNLATTSGGPPLTLGTYTGQVIGVDTVANVSGSGHFTVILTLYANRPAFSYDYDTDLNIQYFAPIYNEVQPNIREYQGESSDSVACGYEQPLTITAVTNTSPPVVTVAASSKLNAANGNQVVISGITGATGANGTFYACAVSDGLGGSFALNTSSSCLSTGYPSAPGVYASGGTAYPQYQIWTGRPPRDAYYNIPYSASYIPVLVSCSTSGVIPALGINTPNNWPDSGYYDMVYNSAGGSSAPVIGLFQGRLSKQWNTAGNEHAQPGWFSSNSHWISAYNVSQSVSNNCPNSGGTCAFGFEHVLDVNEYSTTVHGNFGFYVGTAGQLPGPDFVQPIKVEQNAFEGINLSSLYTYNLNYSDPVPQVTAALWSSGTETLTLNIPTSISVGDTINVTGFSPSSYDCSSCSVTAIASNSVSYSLASNPGAYTIAGSVSDTSNTSFGWSYPYMSWPDFTNWIGLFQNSTSFCSSTGTCSGASGYYTTVVNAGVFPTVNLPNLWHYNTSAYATAAFNGMYNAGSNGMLYDVITGASWSNGTETLTIGPHHIVVGEEIAVNTIPSSDTAITYVTAVTPTTISYSQGTNLGSGVVFANVKEYGTAGVINDLANGVNLWLVDINYYQWYLDQFATYFPVCAALIVNMNTSAIQKDQCKRALAIAAAVMWDGDFWPLGSINGFGTTTTGDNGGLGNQQVQFQEDLDEMAAQLNFQPNMSPKLGGIASSTIAAVHAGINEYGSGASSLHYQGTYDETTVPPFQNMALSGQQRAISFANPNYPYAQHISWDINGLTPPEPRFGGIRKCLSDGDGNTEATCMEIAAYVAEGLAATNPTAASNGMWGWFQSYGAGNSTNKGSYTMDSNSAMLINPLIPAVTPNLSSINFPGYWSIARYGFGTPHETSVHFINGDFYSTNGHRHFDDGQVSIYAHNAPLAIDWNANLYYPDTGAAFCHNRIVLDSELTGNLGAWDNGNPNCAVSEATTAGGGLLTANNTHFSGFANSTNAIGTFGYTDGSYWQRTVRTMAPDTAFPIIYVTDTFANGSCASSCLATTGSKTLTWNMMANANTPVSTPSGNLTPVVRFSAGCQSPAGQAPSANDTSGNAPYALSNGLQTFGFSGYSWPALSFGSINWNVYQRPTSGTAQFLIGNWGHGCNTGLETSQFATANASAPWYNLGGNPASYCVAGNTIAGALCEQQDILRVHDTGPFETVITPVENGTTLPSVSYNSGTGLYTATFGSGETEVWGDCDTTANSCFMTFTDGTEQVLSSYDANSYSAFGFTAFGGAQELVNNGAGDITWTIDDVTTGTRCVTLPAGTWFPSVPVQYRGGQYCYYHGGGAQPVPVTITFTHTAVTMRTVTLDYYAPPGSTQVAVKFGNNTNYAALASCSPTCSVTLLAPAGTYTEQHAFLGSGGAVITTSQPVSLTY